MIAAIHRSYLMVGGWIDEVMVIGDGWWLVDVDVDVDGDVDGDGDTKRGIVGVVSSLSIRERDTTSVLTIATNAQRTRSQLAAGQLVANSQRTRSERAANA